MICLSSTARGDSRRARSWPCHRGGLTRCWTGKQVTRHFELYSIGIESSSTIGGGATILQASNPSQERRSGRTPLPVRPPRSCRSPHSKIRHIYDTNRCISVKNCSINRTVARIYIVFASYIIVEQLYIYASILLVYAPYICKTDWTTTAAWSGDGT